MRLLVNATNFGLGSAGKLASILDELPDVEIVVYGSELGLNLFAADRPVVGRVSSGSPVDEALAAYGVDAALVVLDPPIAATAAAAGYAVAYVDSLPFLWSRADDVPGLVTAYLAQQTPALPRSCWEALRSIRALRWIEAIVPALPPRRSPASSDEEVVINLGGLTSWYRSADDIAYPAVVLPPLLDELGRAGYGSMLVATSETAIGTVRASIPAGPNVVVRSLDHASFCEAVAAARLLVTSPGLTTLLESGAMGVPTVVLPAQNLSQCMNTAAVAAAGGGSRCVTWPPAVVDAGALERARAEGESAALEYLYQAIEAARGRRDVEESLRAGIAEALVSQPASPAGELVRLLGRRGARQVADAVLELGSARQVRTTRRRAIAGAPPMPVGIAGAATTGAPVTRVADTTGRAVFVAGPFKGIIDEAAGAVPLHERRRIGEVVDYLEEVGFEVFNAHRRERWGEAMLAPEECTKRDFEEISLADAFVGFPGDPFSPGTHVELGWASALAKPMILIVDDLDAHAFLVRGLHAVANVTYLEGLSGAELLSALRQALDRALGVA